MSRTYAFFLMSLLVCIGLSARPAYSKEEITLPLVMVKNEAGFITVQLPLLQHKTFQYPDKTKGIALEFGGSLDGKPVGMHALIVMDWEEQRDPSVPFSFWWSEVVLERSGFQTDNLVQALALHYDVKVPYTRAKDVIPLKVVSIAKKPTASTTEIKLKVFVSGEPSENPAEFYFNIDFKNNLVELSEKDPEHRSAILRAFSRLP